MSEQEYVPKSKAGKWFNDRLPLLSLASHLTDYPTPKNLNYWWTFGGILTFCLLTQIITGIVLAMHYVAHADLAFASVEHIMRDVNYGWLIRYIHSNGASMFFLAVYIHIFRSLFYGSYKSPREIIWIIGLMIYLLMMAAAFMGYVLPWGQMSFWGATVITNLFSAIPLVGDSITTWLWGAYSVDNPTLTRFFSLHYLIPFLILGLVVLHIWALHVPGNNNPVGIDIKKPSKDTVPFHPYITIKDAFALLLFMIIFAGFVFFAPNVLGHADNYIQANPMVTPAHIVPEWYLLPFYAILRSVPDKLGGVILMFGAIFILFVLPWLDTSKVRSAVFRPIYRQFFWILIVDVLVLGYVGAMPAEGIYLVLARVGTVYYFLHFLVILPVVGYLEKTEPVPLSISEPVLSGSADYSKEKVITICADIEDQLSSLTGDEKFKFMREIGLEKMGINKLIKEGYDLLSLETFFTSGKEESRAWTVRKNTSAPKAASVIHTDFEKNFIRVEAVDTSDFIKFGSTEKCKENGKLAASAFFVDVKALNKVDLPTLGKPTIPHLNPI